MGYDMYIVDNCYGNITCKLPPYEKLPPDYYSRNTSGSTTYHSTYKGGAQKENYTKYCVPIFEDFENVEFPCTFIITKEANQAYLLTPDSAPKEFNRCCILQKPFHPPPRTFTKNMNFYGVKNYNDKKYIHLGVNISGPGPFEYSFWNETKYDAYGDPYYEPSFFYFLGIKNKVIFQTFANFSIDNFDPAPEFTLPAECLGNVPRCPFQTIKSINEPFDSLPDKFKHDHLSQ